jgi:hypothetical protein
MQATSFNPSALQNHSVSWGTSTVATDDESENQKKKIRVQGDRLAGKV